MGERWRDGLVGAVLGATVFFLALFIMPGGWDPFRFPKVLILRSSALMLLTIHILWIIWTGSIIEWRMIFRCCIARLALLMVTWCALTAALSPEPQVSWWAFSNVAAALVLYLSAAHYAWGGHGRHFLLLIILAPGIITTMILGLQALDFWHPLVGSSSLEGYRDAYLLRKAALLGNRDDVGLYLLLPFSIALGYSFSDDRRRRTLAYSSAIVLIGGLLLSTTITAIFTAGMLLWMSVAFSMMRRGLAAAVRITVLLGLAALIALAGWHLPFVSGRLDVYRSRVLQAQWSDAIGLRTGTFVAAAEMIRDHPLLGVGPGRFPVEYVRHAIEVRERYPWLVDTQDPTLFDMAHNDYLEVAAEAGIPSLFANLALIAILLGFFRRALEFRHQHDIALSAILALLSVCLSALLLFPLQLAAVYGTLAILLGFAWGALS